MDAAVRVKNHWWFEDVADRAEAGQRGLDKLLDVIRADDIEFDVVLDPAPDQPDPVNTCVAFDDAAWSGAQNRTVVVMGSTTVRLRGSTVLPEVLLDGCGR